MVLVDIALALLGGFILFCLLAWVAVSVLDANNDDIAGIVETLTGQRARAERAKAKRAAGDAPD